MKRLNKKGFTLIELLAVIAILAILIVIAVPTVLNLFQTSKKNSFVTQAQTIFKAAEQSVITQQINGRPIPTQLCYVFTAPSTYTSGSTKIDLEGTKKLSYDIRLTAGKITSFKIANGDYSITKTGTDVNVGDIDEKSVISPAVAITNCN